MSVPIRNCLQFVLAVARYGRKGDYMLIRKSHWGWFPHFAAIFEMPDDSIMRMEYVPVEPRKQHWWLLPLFFKGKVVITEYAVTRKEERDWL